MHLNEENVDALMAGIENLAKHIENVQKFGLPYVVAINKFTADTEKEVEALTSWCKENNHPVAFSEVWAKGGKGGLELADKIIELCEKENSFHQLYPLEKSIEEKINMIVKEIYGGKEVVFTDEAREQLETFEKRGWGNLPICMAKTPNSLTDNAKVVGRPTDFTVTVKELRISHGAGFTVVLCGSVLTMPGLPKHPAACDMSIDENGIIKGLF